jgi:uncharacterized protein YciI
MPELEEYLYLIQPTRVEMLSAGPTPQEADIVSQHFSYLEALTKRGVVLLAGRTHNTDERSFGIVIFKAESEEAARAIMNNDPTVQAGVMRARLFPYRIALMAKD